MGIFDSIFGKKEKSKNEPFTKLHLRKTNSSSIESVNSLENSKCLFQLPENFELQQIKVRFDKIVGKCFRENQDKPFVISYNEYINSVLVPQVVRPGPLLYSI